MTKLRECPFCGSDNLNLANTGACWVACLVPDCGCEGPVCDTEEDAANSWNTRAAARPALPTREEVAQTLCHPTKRESIDAILALFTLTGEQDQSISKASYCALCDLEHQLHEDAQGFHHVIKGKRVACASAKSGEEG